MSCSGYSALHVVNPNKKAPVQIFMFSKVKKHWVFVSSWKKGMRSYFLTNELLKSLKILAFQCCWNTSKKLIWWHQYIYHCELALEEQFFRQPFHTKFRRYLLVTLNDLTLQVYSAWSLPGKDLTFENKMLM